VPASDDEPSSSKEMEELLPLELLFEEDMVAQKLSPLVSLLGKFPF